MIATQSREERNIIYEPIFAEEFLIVGHPSLDTKEIDLCIEKKDWASVETWLQKQVWLAYDSNLAMTRRFWLANFKKRPNFRPQLVVPDMHTILKIISQSKGLTIVANYLSEELISESLLKEIWRGHTPTLNTLYLAYDKTQITTDQIKTARKLVGLRK